MSEVLKDLRFLYGDPMRVFSSCLRSVIKAPEGKQIYCADYAAIEARVLFWIAEHEAGIKAYENNRPIYEEMAAEVFNIDVKDVTKDQRSIGKFLILGCGYGMGWNKFIQSCANANLKIEEDVAQKAVQTYRTKHAPVVKLWANIERAAVAAVKSPGKKYSINKTKWWVYKNFLWCQLPSGRRLAYYGPEIKYEPTPWGEKRPAIYHYGVNALSRQWEPSGTYGGRLAENVIQAVARDIMAAAMLRVEGAGYEITLSVHDELLAEAAIDFGSVSEFEALMAETPVWAQGCPIAVEGWSGPRYRK